MTSKIDPQMAGTIERRRLQLGLTIGDLAAAAGITRQGLDPLRKGEVRQYNDRTIIGVARALQWENDWYDRLTAGKSPVELRATIASDDSPTADLSSLSEEDRAAVRAIIESLKAKRT